MLIPPKYGEEASTKWYARVFPVTDMLNGPEELRLGPERTSIFREWLKHNKHAVLVQPWEAVEIVKRQNGMIVIENGFAQSDTRYFPAQPTRGNEFEGGGGLPPAELEDYLKKRLKWKTLYWSFTPLQETKHGRMLISSQPFTVKFHNTKHASACNIPSRPIITEGTVTIQYNKECK